MLAAGFTLLPHSPNRLSAPRARRSLPLPGVRHGRCAFLRLEAHPHGCPDDIAANCWGVCERLQVVVICTINGFDMICWPADGSPEKALSAWINNRPK